MSSSQNIFYRSYLLFKESLVKKNDLSSDRIEFLDSNSVKKEDARVFYKNNVSLFDQIQNGLKCATAKVRAEQKKAYRYFVEHAQTYRLKKVFQRGTQQPHSAKVRPLAESDLIDQIRDQLSPEEMVALQSDDLQLKNLSHLRNRSDLEPIDREVFQALFAQRAGRHLKLEVICKLLSHIAPSLFLPPFDTMAPLFLREAADRDRLFLSQIAEEKGTLAEKKEKLRVLARQTCIDIRKLELGTPYFLFGGVHHPGNTYLTQHILSQCIPKDLSALLSEKSSKKAVQNLTEDMKKCLQKERHEMGKQVEEAMRYALSKVKGAFEMVLPKSILDSIKSSLEQDCKELFLSSIGQEQGHELGEKIWKQLKENGVEKTIQDTLLDALETGRLEFDMHMQATTQAMVSSIPAEGRHVLSASGILQSEEEQVCFAFERQSNGKFKLTLFAEGLPASFHPEQQLEGRKGVLLPLVYSDIDLDENFFYTLFSYRALPKWDSKVSFGIEHLYEGLIASLGKEPDGPEHAPCVPLDELQGDTVWKQIIRYFQPGAQMSLDQLDRPLYELRIKAFAQMWTHLREKIDNPSEFSSTIQQLKPALSTLTEQGIDLYQNKQLSQKEFKALYATVSEVEDVLSKPSQVQPIDSVVVPTGLQKMLRESVLNMGVFPQDIAWIKDMLSVVYGPEVEEVVDQAFRDIFPDLTPDEMNEMFSNRCDDDTWTRVKRVFLRFKNFRLSALHLILLYIDISVLVSNIFSASIAASLIESLILTCFPNIMMGCHPMISMGRLAKALVCFGPNLLKPVLPDSVYQGFSAAYQLAKEVPIYLQRRLTLTVLRALVRILIGGEQASKLSAQARNWNQKITRSGELSYTIPHAKPQMGHLIVTPGRQPVNKAQISETKRESFLAQLKVILPRPSQIRITEDNLKQELIKWQKDAQKFALGAEKKRDLQRLFYINRQFRNLKLPSQTVVWDRVDPSKTMELINQVICSMSVREDRLLSLEESAETTTTLYTAYAIMDYLAHRIPDGWTAGSLKANGCDLALWMQSPATSVIRKDTLKQLEHTARYFGFEIEKTYSEQAIDQHRTACFFNYEGRGERWFIPSFGFKRSQTQFTVTRMGFELSSEGQYYKQLLKNARVREKLKKAGVGEEASDWEKFKVLFDTSKNILPTPFAMLLEMDQRARYCVTNGRILTRPLEVNQCHAARVHPLIDRATRCFHWYTRDLFRRQTFNLGLRNGFVMIDTNQLYLDEIQRKVNRRGKEQLGNHSERELLNASNLKELFAAKQARPVNVVMTQTPLKIKDVPEYEARLMELINGDKQDQMLQVIGFFKKNMNRFRESRFRLLFSVYINRLGAFSFSGRQGAELPRAMASFFKRALDQFGDEVWSWPVCLFLTEMGQLTEQLFDPFQKGMFPDFRAYLRHFITKLGTGAPVLRLSAYRHLIFSYGFREIKEMTTQEKKVAIRDIAILMYTFLKESPTSENEKSSLMVRTDETLFIWKPHVIDAMKYDLDLRKEVIEHIMHELGQGWICEEGNVWKGTYPVFTNGKMILNLETKTCNHFISIELARQKGLEVVSKLGKGMHLEKNSFIFPDQKITVEFAEGTYEREIPAVIYREFEGKKYKYLPSHQLEFLKSEALPNLSEKDTVWLEQASGPTRRLLCMQGEREKWNVFVKETKDKENRSIFQFGYQYHTIRGLPVREVDLLVEPHGLALLTWFTDQSQIKAYAHVSKPDHMAFIMLPKWGLCFEIKEQYGQLQAVDVEGHTGYFISKKQRCQPLLEYGRYLLMENDLGKEKVYLLSEPLKRLMAQFVVCHLTQIQTSPLIESYIHALSKEDQDTQLLTFDVDASGHLITSDPTGLAYLALFHLIRRENKRSFHYFLMIEEYGKKHPFPAEMSSIIEMMYLPLLVSKGRFSCEMALRLGAIQSENRLMQRHQNDQMDRSKQAINGLKWALFHVKYQEYLTAVRHGVPPILDDFQELFLLSQMGRENQKYFNMYLAKSVKGPSFKDECKKIGLECVANTFLFSPDASERYHQLRLQLNRDAGLHDVGRGLVIQALNSIVHSDAKSGGVSTKSASYWGGGLHAVCRNVEKVKQSALIRAGFAMGYALFEWKLFYQEVVLDLNLNLSQLPTDIWEFDQTRLIHYFPLYYRLAKNEPHPTTDRTLFDRKRKALIRNLALARGKISSEFDLRREILEVVSQSAHSYSSVSAHDLEDAISKVQQANTQTIGPKECAFADFLQSQLITPCYRARCSIQIAHMGIRTKLWSATKKGMHTAMYLTPGFLLSPIVEGAQCVYQVGVFARSAINGDTNLLNEGLRTAAKAGSFAMGLLCPQYRLAMWGVQNLSYLPRLWTLKRSIEHEKARDRKPSVSVTSKSRSKLGAEPLESDLALLLKRRSALIDQSFDALFDQFFDSREVGLPIESTPVEIYRATSDDVGLERAFTKINQSLVDYYNRALETQIEVRLKKGKNVHLFVERVRELVQEMARCLKKEEDIIVDQVKQQVVQGEVDLQMMLRKRYREYEKESLTFKQIYTLFTRADDEAFIKTIRMNQADFRELKKRLYLYQVVRRRFNLLFNQVEQKESAFKLALELKRRPAYDLDQTVPELILRAKLSYEVALEFMLYTTALQSVQLDGLLLEKAKKATSEQIMGTGKTFLLPISNHVFADGKTLVCNTVINAVAPSNFNFFINSGKNAFNQEGTILRFDRSMHWTTQQLWALTMVLKRALYLGGHVDARQKDWQALDLMRLEECLDEEGKFSKKYGSKEWELRQSYYKECIDLLDEHGLENSDEKHKLDDPTSNILNFPMGQKCVLQNQEVDIINEIMLFLLTAPEIGEYITIKAKRPEKLSIHTYQNHVKKPLSDWIAALEYFDIPEKERTIFAAYLRGELRSIPDCVKCHPKRRAIGQAKGCITTLLENALHSLINVDFTVSQREDGGEFTRPAEGNNAPLEDATDLKPDINYIRTLMRLFQTRLTKTQLEKLLRYLKMQATKEGEQSHLQPKETPVGRFFALHCPGFQIDTYGPSNLTEIFSLLNRSDRAIALYAKRFIAPQIEFFGSFLSSNFANFHSLFGKGERSRTGTPRNQYNYSPLTKILAHPGTIGETVHILEKKVRADAIHVLEVSDPQPALEEVIVRFFQSDPQVLAFIDLDPICNNMSGEAINCVFQSYIQDKRPELKGVVFYNKERQLVIAEKGGAKPIPFEQSAVSKEQRLSIFSHTQTTGSDIPQSEEAKAILTVGENITLTNLAQAFDRMRQVRRGKQQVIVVMTKRARARICERLQTDAHRVPTIREIIQLAAENEERQLDSQYYLAARYHLHDIVRKACDRKARQQPTVLKMAEYIRKCRDIFVTKVTTDPFEAYGGIDVEVEPEQSLVHYKDFLCNKIRKNGFFSPLEMDQIKEKLDEVVLDHAKEKVHMYEGQEHRDDGAIFLNQSVYQIQDQNAASKSHQSMDLEQDVNLCLRQQVQHRIEGINQQKPHYGYTWPKDLNPCDVDRYFKVSDPDDAWISSPVPLYSMRLFLKLRKDLAYLKDSISPHLFVSENFAQQRDNRWVFRAKSIEPFGEHQTPLYKALVIQDRRNGAFDFKMLLLQKEEIPFWREKLKEKKNQHSEVSIALYDFGTQTMIGDPIEHDFNFTYAVAQARFLSAELIYDEDEKKALCKWMHSLGPRGAHDMRCTFERLHLQRKMGNYEGSAIQTLLLDADNVPLDMRIKV